MRRSIIGFSGVVLLCGFGGILVACASGLRDSSQQTTYYEVQFLASEGGRIVGRQIQTIPEGGTSEPVTAVAEEGYYFVGWSDGNSMTNNTDESITQSVRVLENVSEGRGYLAIFEKITLYLSYSLEGNGRLDGETVQSLKYGDDASTVTAIPDEGCQFNGWSDGVKEESRTDLDVQESITVTALFGPLTKTYEYDYKYATGGDMAQEEVSLIYGALDTVTLPVPTREHCTFDGWYSDDTFTQRVSDETGRIVVQEDVLLYGNGTKLFANWISDNQREYKILFVYVTEVNAYIPEKTMSWWGRVQYSMTDTEKQICHMITQKIAFELNDMRVANFIVDEYFTKETITEEHITQGGASGYKVSDLDARNIPEIADMLDDYQSILVSFSMNDWENNFRTSAGAAGPKYGWVHWESTVSELFAHGEPLEVLLDENSIYWNGAIGTYIHELTHTIEGQIHAFEYHVAIAGHWSMGGDRIEITKLYLMGRVDVDGENVGIPYGFWTGDTISVKYNVTSGGHIERGEVENVSLMGLASEQTVVRGYNALPVVAVANSGYEFVGWSDGVKTAQRHDINVQSEISVTAIFRKIEE